jgi:hypothetical protein
MPVRRIAFLRCAPLLACFSALFAGCGSSSSEAPSGVLPIPGVDAGLDSTLAGVACTPGSCAQGQTCCLNSATQSAGALSVAGVCTPEGSCPTGFSVGCTAPGSCADAGSDAVCCASLTLPVGFQLSSYLPPEFDLSQLNPATFDASGLDASGFGLDVSCQAASSCAGVNQVPLCGSSAECTISGTVCYGTGAVSGALAGVMGCIPAAWVGDASPGSADAGLDSPSDSGPSDSSAADAPGAVLVDATSDGPIETDAGPPPPEEGGTGCTDCPNQCYASAGSDGTTVVFSCEIGSGGALLCSSSNPCPNDENCIIAENNCNCSLRYDNAASGLMICDTSSGAATCAGTGATCSPYGVTDQCCDGGTCNSAASPAVCVSATMCGPTTWSEEDAGSPCMTSADCCNSTCPPGGGTCGGPATDCASSGSCTLNSDCCSNTCNTGADTPVCASATCSALDGPCTTDSDCCGANCGNGTCGGNCLAFSGTIPSITWSENDYDYGSGTGGTIASGTYYLTGLIETTEYPATALPSSQIELVITATSASTGTLTEVDEENSVVFISTAQYTTSGSTFTFGTVTCAGVSGGRPLLSDYAITSFTATSTYLALYGSEDGQIPYIFEFSTTKP